MDDPKILAAVVVAGTLVVVGLIVLALSGFNTGRIGLALQTLRGEQVPVPTPPKVEEKPAPPPKPSAAPVRFLALLQREGRLLDFLLEDIQAYQDNQIGAAVRDIHRQCQSALKEHLVLEPVMTQGEGDAVEVPSGFDPSAIRLTGNVTGKPPFKGTLQHHGWRVKEIKLGPPPDGQDEFIIMPAEVELT